MLAHIPLHIVVSASVFDDAHLSWAVAAGAEESLVFVLGRELGLRLLGARWYQAAGHVAGDHSVVEEANEALDSIRFALASAGLVTRSIHLGPVVFQLLQANPLQFGDPWLRQKTNQIGEIVGVLLASASRRSRAGMPTFFDGGVNTSSIPGSARFT